MHKLLLNDNPEAMDHVSKLDKSPRKARVTPLTVKHSCLQRCHKNVSGLVKSDLDVI